MKAFSRIDNSLVGQWWWSVDRWLLFIAVTLLITGGILSFAASPVVAERIGLTSFYFVKRHIIMIVPAIMLMLVTSMLSISYVKRMAFLLFIGGLVLLVLTPLVGVEIKGARRWITFFGFSLQVSEFIKPAFAIMCAWLLSRSFHYGQARMWSIVLGLYLFTVGCLLFQPDFGMAFVISGIWGTQLFLAGLPLIFIFVLVVGGLGSLIGAYYIFPHVASRIDRFLDPASGDMYQVKQSMEAFINGGWFGQGPGEGIVKRHLPDAHADFVFAVAGEEFGYLLCLSILFLFISLIGRSFYRAYQEKDLFLTLSIVGISMQFMLQTFINIASSLHLIPTKGMTLPFLSYGGSSLLAISMSMGMLLAFTRKRKTRGY